MRPDSFPRACRRSARRFAGAIACLLASCLTAAAETRTISPATVDTNEELENLANALAPGDELILRGGVYSQTGRRAFTCKGTAAQPIIIRAADGETPVVTRPADPKHSYPQNNIELVDCEHLVLRGIHFRGGDIGVRFIGGRHVTIEDCEISETGNNAVAMNSGNTDSCIFRRNHIHHTGLLDSSVGTTEGEGFYVGCNSAGCVASNHLFEGNYIHHLRATSDGGNDGIEIKYGSWGNVIRDNVIHDTDIGQRYPGVFVYGVTDPSTQSPNIVEGNVIWRSGEAILAVSDVIVRNNIIFDSVSGISSYRHTQVPELRNVVITGNTVVHVDDEGLYLRWSGGRDAVLAGNAVYNPTGTAVNASGLTGATMTVLGNAVEGGLSGASVDGSGFVAGGRAEDAFTAVPGIRSGGDLALADLDLFPRAGSPLLGVAPAAHAPAADFNGSARAAPFDAGAYERETSAANPGWKLQAGFKSGTGGPPPPGPDRVPPAAPTNLRVR